jgi:transposase
MSYNLAGIDVHKKVLMVVVADATELEWNFERRRFGTTRCELRHLAAWLGARGVQEAVMESTAQYWKPVWLELEPHLRLHLAQAHSNRAPRGRKHDFGDAERLVRRLRNGELSLSYVPDGEQRAWRTIARMRYQLTRERVRLHSQVECLLEEAGIKLSSVLSDLLGVSGRRILSALAHGQTDPAKLAELGDNRLKCTQGELTAALQGRATQLHQSLLWLYLERLQLVEEQSERLNDMLGQALQAHQDAVARLAEVPGFGALSAQQVVAEVGPQAQAFDSAARLTSWAGTCPGRNESAEQNHSAHSPKGNKYLRRVLTQAAQAAVKKKGCHFQVVFRRLLPRLGYKQAIWAIAHRLCRVVWKILHEGVRYLEQGALTNPEAHKRRTLKLVKQLRKLGYTVQLTLARPATAAG